MNIKSSYIDLLRLDTRSLSLSRVFLGASLIVNLAITVFEIDNFFTEDSAIPKQAIKEVNKDILYSLNFINGEFYCQLSIFVAAILSALALCFGFKTKVSAFLSWVLFLSIYNRCPIIFDGGDIALKLFLLCFCFLPVSNHFSIGTLSTEPKQIKVPLFASILFSAQLAYIYFFSAILKSSPRWYPEGSALYYALALDTFTSDLGKLLLHFPKVLKASTIGVWIAELSVPILLFIPIFTGVCRYIAIATFLGFHIGIILFMNIGIFPWTMISAWIAIIPSAFWESAYGRNIEKYVNDIFQKLNKYLRIRNSPSVPFFGIGKTNTFLSILILAYITAWNIRTIDFNKYEKYFSAKLNWIGASLGIDQYWPLFAPFPMTEGGWYMFIGKTTTNVEVDVFTGDTPDFKRPFNSSSTYKNFRWKKYLINLWHKNNASYRKYLANHLCNSWNKNKDVKLTRIEMYYMLENVLPPEFKRNKAPPNKTLTWSQICTL